MSRDTILFDINETVLDLGSLKPRFKDAFGDESVTATWFSMLLHTSTVCVLTDTKTNFATLAGTMLDSIAARLGVELADVLNVGVRPVGLPGALGGRLGRVVLDHGENAVGHAH